MNVKDINPMDWHNTKQLNFIPAHFTQFTFNHNEERLRVLAWAEQNIAGRFAIEAIVDSNKTMHWLVDFKYRIGFENPADATMYAMFFK